MLSWKGFLVKTGLFISLLSVSGGTTYLACYSQKGNDINNNIDDDTTEPEMTPQEKLINSLVNVKMFDLDARLDLSYQKTMADGFITFNGSGDFSDLNSIKMDGTADIEFGSFNLDTSLGFYNSNLYFKFNESYLYLPGNSLLDFIGTLPSMGMNIAIPDEFLNLDINEFEKELLNMEPIKDVQGYYFTLSLSDNINLMFITDDEYNFKGVRTNKFFYKDLYLKLEAKLDMVEKTKVELIDPLEIENGPTYTNFNPVFSLINGMYNTFNKKTNGVNINIDLNKFNNEVNEDLFKLSMDLNYDIDNSLYNIVGNIQENGNEHFVSSSLLDGVLYANYNDAIKFSIGNQTIGSLIDYVLRKVDSNKVDEVLAKITEITNNIDIISILTNFTDLNKLIKSINTTEDKLEVIIDPSILNITADEIKLYFSFSHDEFLGLSIDNFNIEGINGSIQITPKEYTLVSINESEYAKLEYPLATIPHIEELINQTQFRMEFEGSVTNSDASITPVIVDGGFQFDLTDDINNGYGYGELNITDRDSRGHNLYVDLKDKNEVLFNYNKKMKGKFKTQTVIDIVELVKQIVNEKDEHFMELFKDILVALEESEISKIIKDKNYGKLLASNIISNLQTSTNEVSLDIDASLIGIEGKFKLIVKMNYDEENSTSKISSLEVKELKLGTEQIDFKISLKDFDSTLESTRLNASDEYLDFSDIKFLLSLGINTSKTNDWHFKATVGLSFSLALIPDFGVDIDIKIKNIKGNVKAIIAINDIPVLPGVNPNPKLYYGKNRNVVFYYSDNMVYGYRSEYGTTSFIGVGNRKFEAYFVSSLDYFMNNIMDYLLKFALSFSDTIIDSINSSGGSGPTKEDPIKYENVLNDFAYNAVGEDFNGTVCPYYLIDINLIELTKNKDLEQLQIKVYQDKENDRLKGLNIYFKINVSIIITLDASLELVDFGEVLDFTSLDSYVESHKNDTANISVTDTINNAIYTKV